jgi:hypothetical protein
LGHNPSFENCSLSFGVALVNRQDWEQKADRQNKSIQVFLGAGTNSTLVTSGPTPVVAGDFVTLLFKRIGALDRLAGLIRVGYHKRFREDIGLVIPMKCERKTGTSAALDSFFLKVCATYFEGFVGLHFAVKELGPSPTMFGTDIARTYG